MFASCIWFCQQNILKTISPIEINNIVWNYSYFNYYIREQCSGCVPPIKNSPKTDTHNALINDTFAEVRCWYSRVTSVTIARVHGVSLGKEKEPRERKHVWKCFKDSEVVVFLSDKPRAVEMPVKSVAGKNLNCWRSLCSCSDRMTEEKPHPQATSPF